MAQIRCPECSTEVSDSAFNCPKCGKPLREQDSFGILKGAFIFNIIIILFLLFNLIYELDNQPEIIIGSGSLGFLFHYAAIFFTIVIKLFLILPIWIIGNIILLLMFLLARH